MKCFYHSSDLDGHCSGAIVKYRFPECEMHPINYGDEFPWDKIEKDEEIYLVDFALQPDDLMERLSLSCDLHWVDHHSSRDNLRYKMLEWQGFFNTSMAACELTWEYLFPDKPVPLAVKLLSLYDSWTYQGHELEPMVLPFQMRMRMEDLDPKNWDACGAYWSRLFGESPSFIHTDDDGFIEGLIEEGKLLLRYDDEQKRRYIQTHGFNTSLVMPEGNFPDAPPSDYRVIAVNLGNTNSKVFDSVWDESKYDLMATFSRRKDQKWNVSLYSTKANIDCGAIAKDFGGGGHTGAAGFQCEELPFEY